MSRWHDIYAERMNEKYLSHLRCRYAPFIDAVRAELQSVPDGAVAFEAGCGAANITRLLRESVQAACKFLGIDADPEMLELARRNAPEAKLWCFDVRERANVRPDVIHSHGVLEHFSDEDINRIVGHQLALRPRAILHYVPGAKYETPSYGDERLLTPEQWQAICHPDEIVEFNDGYDFILIWRPA